jgi:hypothetical protein
LATKQVNKQIINSQSRDLEQFIKNSIPSTKSSGKDIVLRSTLIGLKSVEKKFYTGAKGKGGVETNSPHANGSTIRALDG